MTDKQIAASRANGAKSHGPKTEAGRKRSSLNAIKHGLCSELVVINGESEEAFQTLRQSYLDRFQPSDPVELDLVEQMVAATWRIRRSWAIEVEVFNDAMDDARIWLEAEGYEPDAKIPPHAALGIAAMKKERSLANLGRQEARLTRLYNRAMQTLLKLQQQNKSRQNEPGDVAKKTLPLTQPAAQPPTPPPSKQFCPPPTAWPPDHADCPEVHLLK
jgi:hypothetical protein